MKPLELYRFVTECGLEVHSHKNDGYDDVIMFVPIYHMEGFNKLLGPGILDEEGLSCTLKDGYLCFWMRDICEYFGFTFEEIFNTLLTD